MLLIAGGLPRSGTTMFRRICKPHPAIFLSAEIHVYDLQRHMLDCIRRLQDGFATIDASSEFRRNEERLVAEMFYAANRKGSSKKTRKKFEKAHIHGHKTPFAEYLFAEYEQLLGHHEPRYVYCLRDPVACIQSRVKMPWKIERIERLMRKMRNSYHAFLAAQERHPERLFLFRVEEFAADPQGVIGRFCHFLDIDPDFAEAMGRKPPPNELAKLEAKDQARDRELTEEEIHAIRSDPLIKDVTERFVWRG